MGTNVSHNEADSRYETVLPHCWFMRDHIAEHPDQYLALVPPERRAQFGLPTA